MRSSTAQPEAPASSRSIEEDVSRLRLYIDRLDQEGATRLPPEPKLSEELGVSRSRLRTMLKRVEDEGAIWRHVGKGTFLGRRQVTPDSSAVLGTISIHDFFEARLAIEPNLAAQAAIRATPADIAALDDCIAEINAATSFTQWRRLDDKLHKLIAESTHNALLVILYDALRSETRTGLTERMAEVFGAPPMPMGTTDVEHRACIDAIRMHNPDKAEQAMREHIRSVRDSLFGQLG